MEVTIISGKGGTGKTSITAAFASLATHAVFADCDVDAADLHLILTPKIKEAKPFYGLQVASIDLERCTHCLACYGACRFGAIDAALTFRKEACEGCGVCAYVCPAQAIRMVDRQSGEVYVSETRYGPMAHAVLHTAEEASGKLVTAVRIAARTLADEGDRSLILIDGPPGIGCPVIASLTGVDLVVVVTEPTLSAIHDLERVIDVARHFEVLPTVCINKYTINLENTKRIEQYCADQRIQVIGKLPYDTIVTDAMVHGQTVLEFSKGEVATELRRMWTRLCEVIGHCR